MQFHAAFVFNPATHFFAQFFNICRSGIARVDEDNNALTVYTGKLGVGFNPVYKYNHPTTFNELTLSDVKNIIKNGSEETTKVTEDTTSSKSSNSSGSKKKS